MRAYANVASFAGATVVQAAQLVAGAGLPAAEAALIGCAVSTGYGVAARVAGLQAGDTVVVFGVGGIGVNVLQTARLLGCARIVAVDVNPAKAQAAAHFGADEFVVAPRIATAEELVALVQGAAEGQPVDAAIECSGALVAIDAAIAVTGRGGTTALVGIPPPGTRASFDANALLRNRRIVGSLNGTVDVHRDFPAIVEHARHGRARPRRAGVGGVAARRHRRRRRRGPRGPGGAGGARPHRLSAPPPFWRGKPAISRLSHAKWGGGGLSGVERAGRPRTGGDATLLGDDPADRGEPEAAGGSGEARRAAREVGHEPFGFVGELVEREHHDVAGQPLAHDAAVVDPERVGDAPGELVHARLDGQVAAVAHVLGEQERRVARAAHHLEVGAGVAGPDDGGRVEDQLRHLARVVVRQRLGHHPRREVVLQHPVGEHVGRMAAARRDHVGEGAAEEALLAVAHRGEPHPVEAGHREDGEAVADPVPVGARPRPPRLVDQRAPLLVGRLGDAAAPTRAPRRTRASGRSSRSG